MSDSASLVAGLIRISVFCLALGLFPNRLVPLSVRLALATALFLCAAPMLTPAAGTSFDIASWLFASVSYLEGTQSQGVMLIGYQRLLFEIGVGLFLAVVLSVALYAAEVAAVWLHSVTMNALSSNPPERSKIEIPAVRAMLLLLALSVVFHSGTFVTACDWFLQSMRAPSVDSLTTTSVSAALALTVKAGGMVLAAAVVLILPLVFVALFVDLLFILFCRYFEQAFSDSLAATARLPLLVLATSLALYPFSSELAEVLQSSLSPEKGTELLQLLRP